MEFVNCFSSHIICSAERPHGKRHCSSKRRDSNPYAERGLDRFADLSAELEAKRRKLVSQLGNQLSLVRFAIGSGNIDWIPVIVCPTLSKAETRTLKRTATRLIAKDEQADAQRSHAPGFSVHESNIGDQLACSSVAHVDDAQNSTLNHLLVASKRSLCMVAFVVSIAANIVSDALLSRWHGAEAPSHSSLPSSTGRLKQASDSPSSNMSSSMNFLPSPRICAPASTSAKDVKASTPPHTMALATAPTVHSRYKSPGFSTAPSSPRDLRQAKKSFQASVSFSAKTHLSDEEASPLSGKDSKLSKALSLPKVPRLQERVVQRHATAKAKSAVRERERKERSEKLGQALTMAWLPLGLGGLLMGYIPAIICAVCWWYALPSLRKAVGDKPYVRSHHR